MPLSLTGTNTLRLTREKNFSFPSRIWQVQFVSFEYIAFEIRFHGKTSLKSKKRHPERWCQLRSHLSSDSNLFCLLFLATSMELIGVRSRAVRISLDEGTGNEARIPSIILKLDRTSIMKNQTGSCNFSCKNREYVLTVELRGDHETQNVPTSGMKTRIRMTCSKRHLHEFFFLQPL